MSCTWELSLHKTYKTTLDLQVHGSLHAVQWSPLCMLGIVCSLLTLKGWTNHLISMIFDTPSPYIIGLTIEWNLSNNYTLNKGHLSNDDTICSPNHIELYIIIHTLAQTGHYLAGVMG